MHIASVLDASFQIYGEECEEYKVKINGPLEQFSYSFKRDKEKNVLKSNDNEI